MVPALSLASYGLCLLAAVFALPGWMVNRQPPALGALLVVAAFAGYLVWRCVERPGDSFLARLDLGLVLACGLAFLCAASGSARGVAPGVLLVALGVFAAVQAGVGAVQLLRDGAFHPGGWWSEELRSLYAERFLSRARGTFLNPNQLAWVMNAGLLFCLAFCFWGKVRVWGRILLLYFAGVFLAVLFFTGSRGGMLSMVCGLGMLLLVSLLAVAVSLRRHRGVAVAVAIIGIAAFCVAGYLVYSSVWVAQGRVQIDSTGDWRYHFLDYAWRQFQSAPWLGEGAGSYRYAARLYRAWWQGEDAIFAHDDWAQLLGEYGFAGFALGLVAVLVLLGGVVMRFLVVTRIATRSGRSPLDNAAALYLGAAAAGVAFCTHSLVDFNLHIPANALLAACIFGLGASWCPELERSRVAAGVSGGLGFLLLLGCTVGLAWYGAKFAVADYRGLLAANAFRRGDLQTARREVEWGLAANSEDPELLMTRGRILTAVDPGEVEEPLSEDVLDENPEDTEISKFDPSEADDGKQAELLQAAVVDMRKAVLLRPRERDYRQQLAGALLSADDAKGAAHEALEAVVLDSRIGYFYGTYGDVLEQQEKLEEAGRVYQIGAGLPNSGDLGLRFELLQEEIEMGLGPLKSEE